MWTALVNRGECTQEGKLLSWLHGALLTTGILDKSRLTLGRLVRVRLRHLGTRERGCNPGDEESVLLPSSGSLLADWLCVLARWFQGPVCPNQTESSEIRLVLPWELGVTSS